MTEPTSHPPPSAGPAPIRVREADLSSSCDARALIDLLDTYAQDPMGGGQALSRETRACLIPALRHVPGALVLLAFVPDRGGNDARAADSPGHDATNRCVGAAVCFVGFSTFRARALLNVHDLAVLPQWRGQGVGRRLLQTIERIARGRGYCKLTLEVRQDNPARRLYRRLGYDASACGDGEAAQYLFLEKRLSD